MAKTRRSSAPLVQVLDLAERPIYLLDPGGKIVFANQACGDWLGVEPLQLVGQVCRYCSPGDDSQQTAPADGLCPPPEVFSGQPREGVIFAPPGVVPARRAARFEPLPSGPGQFAGVLVTATGGEKSAAVGTGENAQEEWLALHEEVREFLTRYRGWYSLDRLAGTSAAARRVREQVRMAGAASGRVVVTGPPGSGREHVARAIHYQGAASESLTPLNCPLLDAELLESMVGAFVSRCAELETEYPAALLLLDIDQLPPAAQAALGSLLQVEELEFRCLATARQSLPALAKRGEFDPSLANLLSTVVIELAPLAERPEDVPLLAQFFLEEENRLGSRQLGGFTPEALDRLAAYRWPGNIDELMEVVRQAHQQAEGPLVTPADLPKILHLAARAEAHPPRQEEPIELDRLLAEAESELISRALVKAKGNRAQAARLLSIPRARLLRRLQQLKIEEDG